MEKVEAVYKKNPLVEQMWVYGNSFESVLVAVRRPQPCCWLAHTSMPACTPKKARGLQVSAGRDIGPSAGHFSFAWAEATLAMLNIHPCIRCMRLSARPDTLPCVVELPVR